MKITDEVSGNNAALAANTTVFIDTGFRIAIAIILITSVFPHNTIAHLSPPTGAALVIFTVIYTTLLFLLTYHQQGQEARLRLTSWVAHVDAFIIGIALAIMAFPGLPLALVAPLVLIRSLTKGGITGAFTHITCCAIGAGLPVLAGAPHITLTDTRSVGFISLTAATVFLCYLAYIYFQRFRQLSGELNQAQHEIVDLKLTNYKISKYLSPTLRKAISSGKGVKLETQRKKITVFFSDIKGFSELSEKLETEALTELLNQYLTEMSAIAIKFGGTVDKFIGDGMMVFFGDPVTRGAKADCVACVSMAIAMQKRMQELRQHWQNQGFKEPLQVRMGINTGFCTVGNFGTENRLDYTLLGTEVNLASRLESAAQPGEILISTPTYELIKDVILCEDRGTYQLKGFKEPVSAHAAIDLRKNLGKASSYVEHSTEGFAMYMDMEKIRDYDQQKVLESLEKAYNELTRQRKAPSPPLEK